MSSFAERESNQQFSSVASRKVEKLLRPRSVAVVGATDRPGALGNALLNAIRHAGYRGTVYPVNPRRSRVGALRCYPALRDLPETPDCVAFALPDSALEAALSEAAAAGVPAAVIYGRAYEPPGQGPGLPERLAAIARAAGMAICGNNGNGFINRVDGLALAGNPPPATAAPGGVAFISQSGSIWSALAGNGRDLPISYVISAGREIATSATDYLEFFLDQPDTRVIGCVLETLRDPEGFLAALEQADRQGIPVVALKLGRSDAGRRFALAHSGALAGSSAAFEAALGSRHAVLVDTLDEFLDTVELFTLDRRPAPLSVALATDSGGEQQLIADSAARVGLGFVALSAETVTALTALLDPGMEVTNPLDTYGDGRFVLEESLALLAVDPGVGLVGLATNMVAGRAYAKTCTELLLRLRQASDKPFLLFGNASSAICAESAARLRAGGVPVLMGTENALTAIRNVLRWHGRHQPAETAPPATRHPAEESPPPGRALPPAEALALLARIGVTLAPWAVVTNAAAARQAGERMGYPLVLKSAAPGLLHKTEAGAIRLGITDAAALERAYAELAALAGPAVLVQAQVARGPELLLGMVTDAQFGPLMTLGIGGVFTELYRDVVTLHPPIGRAALAAALERLKGAALLRGFRGTPPVEREALLDALETFAAFIAAEGRNYLEIDINPLIAGPQGYAAVDALIIAKDPVP